MFTKDDLAIIGILRGIEEKDIEPLAEIFKRTGLKYVEITLNTAGAASLISNMIKSGGDDIVVGAGTVITTEGLEEALEAGAKFIVTPSLKDEIVTTCIERGVPIFPGVLTPTELNRAIDLGAEYQKLFPGGAFGPKYIKDLKGPFNNAKIIAVGGVNEQNVADYIKNGAVGIAFGSGVVKPAWLASNNYKMIETKLVELIHSYKAAIQ